MPWLVVSGEWAGKQCDRAEEVECMFEEEAPTGLTQGQHDECDVLKLPSGKVVAQWED